MNIYIYIYTHTGAFLSSVALTPVCLRFHRIRRFNPTWESIRFHSHLLCTMTQLSNSMQLLVLPPFRYMCIYLYLYLSIYLYMYVYIYIKRERERERARRTYA